MVLGTRCIEVMESPDTGGGGNFDLKDAAGLDPVRWC